MILRAPSRIHMALIDLNASQGRVDGGLGLALEEPFIEVLVEKTSELSVNGFYRERTHDAALRMLKARGIKGGVRIDVKHAYEPHMGLGSGTQMMLAVGYAISKIYDLNLSMEGIAQIMGRGGTSGIGTAVFEHGGFIVDGGHSINEKHEFLPSSAAKAKPAPVIAGHTFPDWKIALVIPQGVRMHGKMEVEVFQKHCPIPIGEVRKLSHLILMKTLPAVVEKDISLFGESINEIQDIGFKKIEVKLQSPGVRKLLKRCQKSTYGAGLSSFGPTIYCVVDREDELLNEVGGDAEIIFTKADNRGVKIIG